MPGRFPVGKPRLPSWALPLLAVTVSFILHALWLIFPQPPPPPGPKPTFFSLVAYPNLNARTWSPTLFSLPSSLGFSSAIRQKTSNVLPPLQSPVNLASIEPVDLGAIFPESGLESPLNMRTRLPVTVSSAPPAVPPVQPAFSWRLQVLEGPLSDLELTRLPPPPVSANPLVITGVMSFDTAGQVRSLFLDPQSLAPELRTQVLRALRRVRRNGELKEARIRFRFTYLPVEEEK